MPSLTEKKPRPLSAKAFLKKCVLPALTARLPPDEEGEDTVFLDESEGEAPSLYASYRNSQVVTVEFKRLDAQRALLTFSITVGHFLQDLSDAVFRIGPFVQGSTFRLNFDEALYCSGQISLSSELVIHGTDPDLLTERIDELVQLAADLEWFCTLRIPSRLSFLNKAKVAEVLEPHQFNPDGILQFLRDGLAIPGGAGDPEILVLLAWAMGRWADLLRILDNHPHEISPEMADTIRSRALCELHRWKPSLAAARAAGIKDGIYPGGPWLSPSHLHALIESGDEIEALRLLGRATDGEPGFYEFLRSVARHAAGDVVGSRTTLERYLAQWPGDLAAYEHLDEAMECGG